MTSKCIVDLGPGDGKKTVISVCRALGSGHYDRVTVVLVDYSLDMLNTSGYNIDRTVNRYVCRFLEKSPAEAGYKLERIHGKFEDLGDNYEYQRVLDGHDEREFLFYGTTAGNFDPIRVIEILDGAMRSGDRVQVGLHLYTDGHDDELLKAYEGPAMEDVSFVGLEDLGFTKKDKTCMRYYPEITKRVLEELEYIGPLAVVRTFFEATEPMERGLITLSKGDRLQALSSIKYREDQARKAFTHDGKFEIVDRYPQDVDHPNIAIFLMVKKKHGRR